ncbi:MAG: HAD family hydrolase [Candidatus Micrarchaeia archaeon]
MESKNTLKLKDFDLFVFDWDGTLAVEPLLRRLNKRLNPIWIIKKFRARKLALSKEKEGRKRETEKYIYRKGIYNDIKQTRNRFEVRTSELLLLLLKPRLREGASELLSKLARENKTIILITDGVLYRVYREVTELGVLDYFEVILSLGAIDRLKPDPLGMKLILKTFNVEKDRSIYIGDMSDDILFAKYAGVKSCAVAGGFDSFEHLSSLRPDYIFRSIKELKKSVR